MDLARLIEALSRPAAYPEPPGEVQVRQTHISVVFLAGRHAYKIKKPVALGFLDFRTLEARRRFCAAEVRLNRRLAPAIYQGVVPVEKRIQVCLLHPNPLSLCAPPDCKSVTNEEGQAELVCR